MSYANPIWLEGRRKYWTRPDAYRFAPPGSPEGKMPGWLDPWMTRVRAKEAAEDEASARASVEQEEFERAVLELRWLVKSLKTDLLLRRLRHKYSADQPRAPKGKPEGGQWVPDAGKDGDAASASSAPADLRPGPRDVSAARRRSGISEAECDFQYKQDTFICNLVRTPLCWAQAAERYAACLSGRPLPPLNF